MIKISVPRASPTALCGRGQGQNGDVVAKEVVCDDGAIGSGAIGGSSVAVNGSDKGLGLAILHRLMLLIGAGGRSMRHVVGLV